MDGLHWPENWVKGQRPLEEDTNIEHTFERCSNIRESNKPKKDGWIIRICDTCGIETRYSRKHHTNLTLPECSECLIKRGRMV